MRVLSSLLLLVVLVTDNLSIATGDCLSAASACELPEQTILDGPIPSSPLAGVAAKNFFRAEVDVDTVHSSNAAYNLFDDPGKYPSRPP